MRALLLDIHQGRGRLTSWGSVKSIAWPNINNMYVPTLYPYSVVSIPSRIMSDVLAQS